MSEDRLPEVRSTFEQVLETEPGEIDQVRVRGDFTDGLKLITDTSLSPVFSLGRPMHSEEMLLLPHVQVDIHGGTPNEEGEKPAREFSLSELLPLENAAYLGVQLATGFNAVSRELLQFQDSDLKPEKRRVEHARFLLAHAAREMIAAFTRLNMLLDSYPQDHGEETLDEERAPRPKVPARKVLKRPARTKASSRKRAKPARKA